MESIRMEPTWLTSRLWQGFVTDARAGLQRLSTDPASSPRERSRAFIELARWELLAGRPEDALHDAQLARPEVVETTEQTSLEVDALIAAGCPDRARELLRDTGRPHGRGADRLLRVANTFDDPRRRLRAYNKVFHRAGLAPLSTPDPSDPPSLQHLGATAPGPGAGARPLVSVLVPARDAEATIGPALRSVLRQTWTELEVIVVDDASSDATAQLVAEVARQDPRVRLVRLPDNRGTQVARNVGLEQAAGDLVMVHHADDWSHPQKVELLARQLIDGPTTRVATLGHQVRVLDDLTVVAPAVRALPRLVVEDPTSLLVRREALTAVGSWDAVRRGGDLELLERLEAVHGPDSVGRVAPRAPLSLNRATPGSGSWSPTTGLPSAWLASGARRQYEAAFRVWHRDPRFLASLPLVPERSPRPFPAPALLTRARVSRAAGPEHLDVIMLSDYTLRGGTNASNLQEIQAQTRAGLTVGLLHHRPREWNQLHPLNPKVTDVLDGAGVRMLSHGEHLTCDLLIARFPRAAQHLMDLIPDVEARQTVVVVNQLPRNAYPADPADPTDPADPADPRPGDLEDDTYDIVRCDRVLHERFDGPVTWYPNSPVVRRGLLEHHAEPVSRVQLAASDWVNIIDPAAWRRDRPRPRGPVVTLGRHTRDVPGKWPSTAEGVRLAYPDRPDLQIRVLGGATSPETLLGTLPGNWVVQGFDTVPVREFLHGLDLFVSLLQDDWVDAFPRAVLEALAVGVPAITSPVLQPIFGDAATYAAPRDVLGHVDRLMGDPGAYADQVERGFALVERSFSHGTHLRRLAAHEVRRR